MTVLAPSEAPTSLDRVVQNVVKMRLPEVAPAPRQAPPARTILTPAPIRAMATVLFTDIVGSTEHAVRVGDEAWLKLLDEHDAIVTREIERFRGRLINHCGDGMFAIFSIPAAAVECAWAIRDAVAEIGLTIRSGLHAGECQLSAGDARGIAVHVGARVTDLAAAGEVLVSRTVRDLLLGSRIAFDGRGLFSLKGMPTEWELYAADPAV